MKYDSDPRFAGYYLEDSYVLSVDQDGAEITFGLDCVLTPRHPEYVAPPPSEQHCYRRGMLVFADVSSANWQRRSDRAFTDASGARDYGNIDSFQIGAGGRYDLEGDWGSVEIVAASAAITLNSAA